MAETYSIRFECENCFHVFKEEFKHGEEIQKGYLGLMGIWGGFVSRLVHCPQCGSSLLTKVATSKIGESLNGGIMRCPKCNKVMIKRYRNYELLSYPVQRPWDWWCGGCDQYEKGGIERGLTAEEIYKHQWEKENI